MPVKQQENDEKSSEKIFRNTAKPLGQAILPILVMGVLADSPYPLTVKKIQTIIHGLGFGLVHTNGIERAINNLSLYCSKSANTTLCIHANQRAGDSRAKAFSLTVNNQKSHTNV